MKLRSSALGLTLSLLLAAAACAAAQAQTDVALSVYGAFSGTTTGHAVKEIPSKAAGGMIELRHIRNPLVGYEVTYALNRANQVYEAPSFCSLCVPVPVSANAHEITGDWVFSFHAANLRPFALAGAGVLYFQPLESVQFNRPAPTQNSITLVYVYGVGVDWGIFPHIGLRLQYRGNFYNAPFLTLIYGAPTAGTGNGTVFTHTAEPAIGVYYRF
jgi:hypothetical protein